MRALLAPAILSLKIFRTFINYNPQDTTHTGDRTPQQKHLTF